MAKSKDLARRAALPARQHATPAVRVDRSGALVSIQVPVPNAPSDAFVADFADVKVLFLRKNGCYLDLRKTRRTPAARVTLDVVENRCSLEQLTRWFKRRIVRF